jgi:hypothetical protein
LGTSSQLPSEGKAVDPLMSMRLMSMRGMTSMRGMMSMRGSYL